MPQQINLYLPILRQRKESFTAQTLAQALVIVLLGGAAITAAWVWNLQRASDSLRQTLRAQDAQLVSLRAALESAKASDGPERAALMQQSTALQSELVHRQEVLAALNQGVIVPGQGHAARLRLVAQTVPASAWVSALQAHDARLEISGFILVPEELNAWVGQLSQSVVLRGQSLDAIKVEAVTPATGAAKGLEQWSFQLVSRAPAIRSSQPVRAGGQS